MDYIFVFDCGATKTECAAADTNGNILHTLTGGPANFLVIGAEKASENILSLIKECKTKLNFEYDDIKNIVIGAAGAGREEDAGKLRTSLLSLASEKGISFKSLNVISDAQIALEGAFPNKSGSILIAGTGSIIYGKDNEGKIYRAGGFGRIIGDEGSGYSIGRKALQRVAKFYDGQGEKSDIVSLLSDKYKINSSEELIKKVYKENFDIASVAELVLTAASKDDLIALTILEEETDELVQQLKALMKKMDVDELNVSFAGSLVLNKNIYPDMLTEKIKFYLPKVTIVKAEYTPLEGAIHIARELLNA
jgi:N-acetylglucosamine kinase-like BadF-type ATPase